MLPHKPAAALLLSLALGLRPASAQLVPVTAAAPDSPGSAYLLPAPTTLTPGPVTLALPPAAAPAPAGGVQLPPTPPRHPAVHAFSTAALGLTAGTLGPGVELATPLTRSLNLRGGGTYLNVQYPFSIDGVDYGAAMKLASGLGVIDWFPVHRGFHLSAGALYLKSTINAGANVLPGRSFKLGGTQYLNSVDDPVGGTASLNFPRKLAPLVLIGFGNLIPRSGRHISVPFEIGGAYLKPPQVNLQLAGTACTSQGCFDVATDPVVQANLTQENTKLNRDIRLLQIYPVVSLGFALRF